MQLVLLWTINKESLQTVLQAFFVIEITIKLLHLLDVLDKEDFLFLCHLLEIIGCGDARRCAKVLTLEVAPRQEIAGMVFLHDGQQHAAPPSGIGRILVAALGDCQ